MVELPETDVVSVVILAPEVGVEVPVIIPPTAPAPVLDPDRVETTTVISTELVESLWVFVEVVVIVVAGTV